MAEARYATTNSMIYAIERKAAFIATFLSNDPSDFSFTDLRSRITSSRGTPTTLKLSQSKLSWGEKNPNRSERPISSSSAAMVPYASVQLGLVKELFTEVDHPSVLLCVIRATNKQGFRYEILAFRLQSERDVQLFVNLFPKLTHQHQVGSQSRSMTSFNRDEERSYSPPQSSIRTMRPTSTKLHTSSSMPYFTSSSGTIASPMSPPSQKDGQTFRGMMNGTFRRNHQNNDDELFTVDSSPHISGDRYTSGKYRAYEVQPQRNVNVAGTRHEQQTSLVRMNSQTGRAIDRTFTTRNVGVMADLDSSIPRSRPGDYLPLDGELSSQHDRMYIYADGSKMGDVFCQTNLRSPLRSVSSRHGSSFVYGNDQSEHASGTRMTGTSGLFHNGSRPNVSQQFADESDEIDSAGGYEQRNARNMQRRMTLVDNGVVKVTVEEYQDPAGTKTEEFSFPDGQSSDQTIDEVDANLDRLEISGRHANRIEPVSSGSRDRSSRSNSIGRHRSRQPMTSHESSASVTRTPTMTSSVQRVFRRRSVPRTSSSEAHPHLSPPPVDGVRQKGSRRRSSYKGRDPIDRPYTMSHDDVSHQSPQRPITVLYEPSTFSTHSRPYTTHETIHQSQQPVILRREPMNTSEKKRHHEVHRSHHQPYETVYQSQPITTIRAEPTTYPVQHRSSAHESFYQSQPIITRNEPIRQHRSSTRDSVYNSQPILIRADPTISPIRQHRSTTHESVYQSRPIQMRQKSVNYSDYGHDERTDVYREPRNEYRLVTGGNTPHGGSVIVRQSKSRTTP